MARNYHVQGTKAYLIWALGLLAFGLWSLRDGWFPSAGVLAKHPSPDDSFFLFNRICAVAALAGAAVCAYIHKVVK